MSCRTARAIFVGASLVLFFVRSLRARFPLTHYVSLLPTLWVVGPWLSVIRFFIVSNRSRPPQLHTSKWKRSNLTISKTSSIDKASSFLDPKINVQSHQHKFEKFFYHPVWLPSRTTQSFWWTNSWRKMKLDVVINELFDTGIPLHESERPLIDWLFTVLRPAQEFFTQMEMSPLPVKGWKSYAYARRSGPLSREGSLSCHICCDTGPRFFRSRPKDLPM
jgi:hypothetical protein